MREAGGTLLTRDRRAQREDQQLKALGHKRKPSAQIADVCLRPSPWHLGGPSGQKMDSDEAPLRSRRDLGGAILALKGARSVSMRASMLRL